MSPKQVHGSLLVVFVFKRNYFLAAGQMRRAMPALIRKPLADSKKRHARAHAADRSAAEALGTVHV